MAQVHIISKKDVSMFQKCFDQQKTQWNKHVEFQGDYFEEN